MALNSGGVWQEGVEDASPEVALAGVDRVEGFEDLGLEMES